MTTGSTVRFFAAGLPRPQGSKRGFVVKGRVVLTEAGGQPHKDWRAVVAHEAHEAMAGREPLTGPVRVELVFHMPRPRSHPKTRRTWPTARPDVDKLARSCLDSLTHVCFTDDSQVVCLLARKVWALVDTPNPPGVTVDVLDLLARPTDPNPAQPTVVRSISPAADNPGATPP